MQKVIYLGTLILLFNSAFTQTLNRLDSLFRSGVITESEYNMLKEKQLEDPRGKELDGLLNQGKITQDEYKLLRDLRNKQKPADQKKIRYYFSLETGPSVLLVTNATIVDFWNSGGSQKVKIEGGTTLLGMEVSQGVNLWNKFKLGIGVGYQFRLANGLSNGSGSLPFYLDFSYRPLNKKISPFIIQRIGGAYNGFVKDVFYNNVNPLCLLYKTGIGVSFSVRRQKRASLALNYQLAYTRGEKLYTIGGVPFRETYLLSFLALNTAFSF
jgi:hypothetical protein